MTKCKGCGITLQNSNPNEDGYVIGDKDLCERCFRLKNYGEYDQKVRTSKEFINILKKIDSKSLVVLVLDLFNLPESLDIIKENVNNSNLILVLTKKDLLPTINDQKVLAYMDNYNIPFLDKLVVSSSNNYHLDELKNMLIKYNTNNNIYFIGYTNSGKSTLINKLITNYTSDSKQITTSIMPSTTLDFIHIPFNNLTIIDSPGLLVTNNIDFLLEPSLLKKIIPLKRIMPIIYQLNQTNYFAFDDILDIEIAPTNLIMYFNKDLNINRYYHPKKDFTKEIKIDSNHDLVIGGLGFIKFLKPTTIKISSKYDLNIYTRKSLL